jgi:hypothetical protein
MLGVKMGINVHKDMILCNLWLTKEEIKRIEIALRDRADYIIGNIILEAKERGDFK